MKIFEVAGEGKLHGLTVMSLDAFVNKEDDVEESQVNEIDRRGFLKGLGAGAAAVAGAGLPTLAQAKGPGYWANYAGKLITDKLGSGLKFNPFGGQAPGTITIQSGEREVSGIEFISTNVYDLVTKYCELTDCYNAKQAIDSATSEAIKISKADAFLYKPGYSRQFVLAYRASLDDSIYEWKKAGRPTQAQQQPAQQQPAQQQPAQQEIKLNLKPNRQVGDIITVRGGPADGRKAKVTQILGPNKEGTGNKGLGVIVESLEESDISGLMHAARNYNKSFLITAELAEGGKKTFRVKAQSERVAREKFEKHYNQATIVSVKEEGVTEDVSTDAKVYQNKMTGKFIAWVEINKKQFKQEGDTKEEALQNLIDQIDSIKSSRKDATGKWTVVGFTAGFVSLIKMNKFFAKFSNGKLFVSDQPGPGYSPVSMSGKQVSPTGKFAVSDIQNAGLDVSARYDIKSTEQAGVFDLKHHSDVLGTWDTLKRSEPSLTIQMAGRNIAEASLDEAPGDFGLSANYRAIPDEEMQDLMGRSKNKTKTKRDKFDYPYIHGSNIEVKDEAGKKFDTEKLRAAIMTRPASILGQNAKMQHSETGNEAIFDIGLPALKGLAVNEKTGEFVVVDTCPGAGACQTYCYAMKGSYVMFKAVSMGLARMLNFLLNDPEGFAGKLNSEIAAAKAKYAKKGARIVVRWHDAGDFFSPEYLDMAYKVAEANPDVGFYAYTKMGDVANAARPKNFNMNFSQGAKTGQEKKVNITRTKHSKVVPKDMFFDLIARKGNELIKDAKGRMQFASPENLEKFKTIMAQKYAIDKDSILTYDQMMKTPVGNEPKWNVIVMPGDGDNSANRNDVIGSYLLFH